MELGTLKMIPKEKKKKKEIDCFCVFFFFWSECVNWMAEDLGWRSKEARIQGETDRDANRIPISLCPSDSEMDGEDGRANRRLKI